MHVETVKTKLGKTFSEDQAAVLAQVMVDTVEAGYEDLVKEKDFRELRNIVKDIGGKLGQLAEAQKRSEQKIEELAEAQKRTERKVEELAEAQKRTERKLEELAEAQKRTEVEVQKLTRAIGATRTDLGGLARSVSYALENEAYRVLPAYLRQHGIEITERLVRAEIAGEEINVLGLGKRNGQEVVIVGEAELRLSGSAKIRQLERKTEVVKSHYGKEVVKVFITHFATSAMLTKCREKEIMVVQSFEWA
ncbi:MAG: hypothetical protein D9V47_03230 [Clostridia bacterium]|nr:MAG: hypothetical protein D9V47_03230 [Clostridia bacterium]